MRFHLNPTVCRSRPQGGVEEISSFFPSQGPMPMLETKKWGPKSFDHDQQSRAHKTNGVETVLAVRRPDPLFLPWIRK